MVSTVFLAALALSAVSPGAHAGCLDSFLRLGAHQAPPMQTAANAGHAVERIERLVAVTLPGEPVVGFVYRTADGQPFFGSRTVVTPQARSYVRALFRRDGGGASAAQIAAILREQRGDAILWIPNAARLLPRLGLAPRPCVTSRRLA